MIRRTRRARRPRNRHMEHACFVRRTRRRARGRIVWHTDWNKFMDDYLGLAFQLRRHEEDGQPPAPVVAKNVRLPLKIGVVSLCDYAPGHQLHGIDQLSLANRRPYTER